MSRWRARYGVGVIDRVPEVVRQYRAQRVLLVCGRRSFEASGAARILPGLATVARVQRWSDFAANPDVADLRTGLALWREFQPDLVLGIGGGSPMDMAKLLCGFASLPEGGDLPAAVATGEPAAPRRTQLVLVPTTAGSGAEATHFAVVYVGQRKYSVAHPSLRPDLALLDPALSQSGAAYQRATSGLDAVTQAIESLWAVGATSASRAWARRALACLLPAIAPFVADADETAARAMTIGSHLAGRAIDLSKTTAAHALSYALTKRYGVSHGHAVGLTLGAFLAAHDPAAAPRLRPGVDPAAHAAAMADIYHLLGVSDGRAARTRFEALMRQIGLPTSLSEVGVTTAAERVALAESVNPERLGNNPVDFTRSELIGLLTE